MLKIVFPHHTETPFTQEVAGLRAWNGAGIVRLLAWDEELGAALLERALPGTALSDERDELAAVGVAASVLRRLWSVTPQPHADIVSLETQAADWAATIEREWLEAQEPFERDLMDEARTTLSDLSRGGSGAAPVLLHGDLHHGNVLAASREPWLAIDPKPMLGEPASDIRAPLLDRRDVLLADPDPPARLARRFEELTRDLGVDRDRALAWAFAVEVTWSVGSFGSASGDRLGHTQVEVARLLSQLLR